MLKSTVAITEEGSVTTVVHCKRSRCDVYIGRPSKWGNPFVIGRIAPEQRFEQRFGRELTHVYIRHLVYWTIFHFLDSRLDVLNRGKLL